ncbi:MAG: c-type cytochrome biogenesis protein CcmI [Methyloceanibacter sp.]|uniref:c-type cytochrome biogenesis protein CcmI n=1 Tax=Methyloceanibacter sp. TaxID=1965321 RepID=UPI003EDF8CC8
MLLWVILASLTAIVLFVLLRPLAGSGDNEPARDAFNATVYRDQLDEIEADRARGLIGESEAEAARLEVARRLLAADEKARGKSGEAKGGALARTALIGVALVLPLAALSLYLLYGSPLLPDQPLAARLTDPAEEKNVGALVARVEARLRAHPEEGEGWDAIAPVYMAGRRYADAADAYGQAIRLLGPSAQRLSGYGQALVLEKGGLVSEEARRALEQALASDETLVEPRILLAIAKEQDGDYEAAIEDWRGLMDREGADERWRAMVQTRIADAEAHLSGTPPPASDATPPGVSGPSAADVAAAQTMSPAERQTMVEGMVQKLATRLDAQGDDLAGWLRLVRAYTVLGRDDEAREALARAKSQFAGNTQAIEQLDALAAELGLKS